MKNGSSLSKSGLLFRYYSKGGMRMKRNLLILRIFCTALLLASLGICAWEIMRIFDGPPGFFGYRADVLVSIIIVLPIYISQWEFYRGMNYFLTDSVRTKEKNVSNGLAVGLSALMLAISAATYLFFMERAGLCMYYMLLTGGLLVCNRLVTSIYIAWNAPEEPESTVEKAWRIVNIALRFLILIPVGFGCFVGTLYLLTMIGI